jgi:hypothetical protein
MWALVLVPSLFAWPLTAADGNGQDGQGNSPAQGGNAVVSPPGQPNPGPSSGGDHSGVRPAEPGGTAGDSGAGVSPPVGTATRAEVERMLKEYRQQQKARLEEFRRLATPARQAGPEQKARLREMLRQMLAEQKAERERLVEQLRERKRSMDAVIPTRKEAIEAAAEQARQKHGASKGE